MTEQERSTIKTNIEGIQARIRDAAVRAGRNPEDILLLAATKMNSAERVQAAIQSGIRCCGENKVQELLEKYEQNAYNGADLQFIGTLQTNKVKYLIGK
ncbi:MAG: YggS family pyridoxal phosphate-dependent enzyme, partial [Lachnospiraceae bacterium]|nr:YggS family pyridoxal phosphate-dependent enzyme [Lachnospiraceae bacterium]